MTTHAIFRAAERYGIQLTRSDLNQMILDITDTVLGVRRAASLLQMRPDGVEKWLCRVRDTTIIALYSPESANIITILSVGGMRAVKGKYQPGSNIRGRGRAERERRWWLDEAKEGAS